MAMLDWRKVVASKEHDGYYTYSWPEFIVAAIIPIETPHSTSIPPDILHMIESLQMYILAPVYGEDKISLLDGHIASVWQNNKVLDCYRVTGSNSDLGRWLARFAPWEHGKQLIMANLQHFSIVLQIRGVQESHVLLDCRLEISVYERKFVRLIEWLRSQSVLQLQDIHESCENHIRTGELFLYTSPEVAKSEHKQKQIKKRIAKRLTPLLQEQGLELHCMEIEWTTDHRASQSPAYVPKSRDLSTGRIERRRMESAVEELERIRLQEDLPELAVRHLPEDKLSVSQEKIKKSDLHRESLVSPPRVPPSKMPDKGSVLPNSPGIDKKTTHSPQVPKHGTEDDLPLRPDSKRSISKRQVEEAKIIEQSRYRQLHEKALEETTEFALEETDDR